MGHAKLRGRVLRRRGCMKTVRCQHGCYIMKQHCLLCVRACENESSRSDARSKNWPSCAHISRLIHVDLSAKLHRKSVTTVTDYVIGVKTLRTQDTLDPRHFGTGAEVSIRHFGTSAELSGHFWDTSALRKIIWHCAILYKVDGELGLYSTVIG